MALYDNIGTTYSMHGVPDPRIAAQIVKALGSASRVVNIGAGTGSYEPNDREVIAVEPSEVMIQQRPPGSPPVVKAFAENLPFNDKEFDASMAVLTIHHWSDWRRGLEEMNRVSKRIVIMTVDPSFDDCWLTKDYFPEIREFDKAVFPPVNDLLPFIGNPKVETIYIPHDCVDGFGFAFWRRPEAYLDESVRNGMSMFSKLEELEPGLQKLKVDLESGEWYRKNELLLHLDEADMGYRLISGSARLS